MTAFQSNSRSRGITRSIYLPAACADVRMRSDIQSAPPPDRDQRRRRAFMLEDAEDEFVTSDLALRR